MMEHVSDIQAPPVVEFVNVSMEFHESGPTRPDGPIVLDLQSRDSKGEPIRH